MQTRSQGQVNALELLADDHRRVDAMFERYDRSADDGTRRELVNTICNELSIHAQLEQELFYGALRDAIGDEDEVEDAEVEHSAIRHIVTTLQEGSPEQRHFDANVRVLGAYVRQHVDEEQGLLFPKARASGMDLLALGREMLDRRRQLFEERGLGPIEDSSVAPEHKLHSADSRHI